MMTDEERKKIKAILDTAIGDWGTSCTDMPLALRDFLLHASAALPSALDHMDEQDREIERLRAALEDCVKLDTHGVCKQIATEALKGGGDD